jgi:hypothetical protein
MQTGGVRRSAGHWKGLEDVDEAPAGQSRPRARQPVRLLQPPPFGRLLSTRLQTGMTHPSARINCSNRYRNAARTRPHERGFRRTRQRAGLRVIGQGHLGGPHQCDWRQAPSERSAGNCRRRDGPRLPTPSRSSRRPPRGLSSWRGDGQSVPAQGPDTAIVKATDRRHLEIRQMSVVGHWSDERADASYGSRPHRGLRPSA